MNTFDGVDAQITLDSGLTIRGFYFLPVNILPTAATDLLDNNQDWNESSFDTQLIGVYVTLPEFAHKSVLECFTFSLDEKDSSLRQTNDYSIWTHGFRYWKKSAKQQWDWELEMHYQTGTSRSSSKSTDTEDLDHRAEMVHAKLGYTFDTTWTPSLSLEYDFASGDKNPNDGENNAYKGLYGVARGDLGPTSLWSAFGRTNISSPAIRLSAKPSKQLDFMLCDRFVWLASDTDSWAGLRDKTGDSGNYVGNQLEGRLRWNTLPGNLKLEAGIAHIFCGTFMKETPASPAPSNVSYTYVMCTLSI